MPRDEYLGADSLAPPPIFAISRGREDGRADDPGGGVFEPGTGFSIGFRASPPGTAFDARKVLLTETALKVAGFFVVDADLPCSLFASICLKRSVREASLSEPPLKPASVVIICPSLLVLVLSIDALLFVAVSPFLVGTSYRFRSPAGSSYFQKSFSLALRLLDAFKLLLHIHVKLKEKHVPAELVMRQKEQQDYRPKALLPSSVADAFVDAGRNVFSDLRSQSRCCVYMNW